VQLLSGLASDLQLLRDLEDKTLGLLQLSEGMCIESVLNAIVKRDLELIGVDENVELDQRRWRKIIASPTPTKRENVDFERK